MYLFSAATLADHGTIPIFYSIMLSNTFQSSERGKRELFESKNKFEINVNLT